MVLCVRMFSEPYYSGARWMILVSQFRAFRLILNGFEQFRLYLPWCRGCGPLFQARLFWA